MADDFESSASGRSSRRSSGSRAGADRPIVGRLQAHGKANYQFRVDGDSSYFVRLQTDRGERVLWGKDLERAIDASETNPKLGDLIGAQRLARHAVTVLERRHDARGNVVSQSEQLAHRVQWRIEKVKFFADRARLARQVRDAHADARETVRQHPELKSTFLSMRAAEELASRRIANPEDREKFLDLVRTAIAGSISKGEPLPQVRLRAKPRTAEEEKPLSALRDIDPRTR